MMSLIPRSQLPHKLSSALLLILVALCLAANAFGQTVTFKGQQLQTGGSRQVAADFNGDGKIDLALAGLDVEVLPGNGDGSFQAARKYPVANGFRGIPQNITTGDFNGDSKLDLALALNDPIEVGLMLGNGDATFQQITKFPT
jgi:FG-GAP-like repeat